MLDHLENQLTRNQCNERVLPDFGFDTNNHNDKIHKGSWNVIADHMFGKFKYERLENYIEARNIVTREIAELRKKQVGLKLKFRLTQKFLNAPVEKKKATLSEKY